MSSEDFRQRRIQDQSVLVRQAFSRDEHFTFERSESDARKELEKLPMGSYLVRGSNLVSDYPNTGYFSIDVKKPFLTFSFTGQAAFLDGRMVYSDPDPNTTDGRIFSDKDAYLQNAIRLASEFVVKSRIQDPHLMLDADAKAKSEAFMKAATTPPYSYKIRRTSKGLLENGVFCIDVKAPNLEGGYKTLTGFLTDKGFQFDGEDKRYYRTIEEFREAARLQISLADHRAMNLKNYPKEKFASMKPGECQEIPVSGLAIPNLRCLLGKKKDGTQHLIYFKDHPGGGFQFIRDIGGGVEQEFVCRDASQCNKQIQYLLNPSLSRLPKDLMDAETKSDKKLAAENKDKMLYTFDFDHTMVNGHWHNILTSMGELPGYPSEEVLKRLLDKPGIKNKEALKKVFRDIIDGGNCIAITSASKYPGVIHRVLRELDLTEDEIKKHIYYKEPELFKPVRGTEDELAAARVKDVSDAARKFAITDPKRIKHMDDNQKNITAVWSTLFVDSTRVPTEINPPKDYLVSHVLTAEQRAILKAKESAGSYSLATPLEIAQIMEAAQQGYTAESISQPKAREQQGVSPTPLPALHVTPVTEKENKLSVPEVKTPVSPEHPSKPKPDSPKH